MRIARMNDIELYIMERLVDTCFGTFRVENGKAVSVADDQLYYNIPNGMTNEDIQSYFELLMEYEE